MTLNTLRNVVTLELTGEMKPKTDSTVCYSLT